MNYYLFRPGRTVVRATSHLVKWTLVALLILVLALTTIPSSPDLVQREATILRQHETIHHLDAGPTLSPLTKAMKVLLHHLPARRSESVDHDAVDSLVLDPSDKYQEDEDHEISDGLLDRDPQDHQSSSWENYCNFRGRCKRESVRGNIAYDDHKNMIERAVMSNTLDSKLPQQFNSLEQHDRAKLDGPSIYCKCPPPRRKCHCSPVEHAPIKKESENIAIDAMYPKSHFRPSDPSQKWADYQSNERDTDNDTLDEESGQPRPDYEVKGRFKYNRGIFDSSSKSCSCAPTHQECRCSETKLSQRGNPHTFQVLNKQINQKKQGGPWPPNNRSSPNPMRTPWPSNERDVKDSTHSNLESVYGTGDLEKSYLDRKSISCDCNQGSQGCSCGEFLPLKQVDANTRRDLSTTSDVDTHTVVTPKCSCSPKNTKCICGDQRPRDMIHKSESDATADLADASDIEPRQISNLRKSSEDHGVFDTSDNIADENDRQGNTLIQSISHKEHLTSPSQTIATPPRVTTTQICSERWWNRRPNCRPRNNARISKAESHIPMSDRGNGEFHTSEHIAEKTPRSQGRTNIDDLWVPHYSNLGPFDSTSRHEHISRDLPPNCHRPNEKYIVCDRSWDAPQSFHEPKANPGIPVPGHANIELESPSTSVISRDEACHKLWRVNTSCLPKHSAKPEPVAVHNHPVLRRNETLLESITEANCHGKVGRDRESCEEKHRTGFWIICSLLAVGGICVLFLGLLMLHTHIRRKRRSSPLLINNGSGHKNGVSTPVTSVCEMQISKVERPATCVMRRIDEDETDSVRRYTTLDGTNDGWTSWLQKQKRFRKVSHTRVRELCPSLLLTEQR
jgi:hypothetical protein